MHQAGGSAPWQGPAPSQRILRDFITLRRRLTPYVESSGAARTVDATDGRTPLAAASLDDFTRSLNHLQGFEFGPAFWVQPVAPVVTDTLRVLLPAGRVWVDFWSGAAYAGDQMVRVPAPLELMPVFVRGGSIVPLATVSEHGGALLDPVEIRVFPGADGDFTLRETDSSRAAGQVSFHWNEATQELRIGARSGGADTAAAPARRFEIVIVRPGGVVGHQRPARPNFVVDYRGEEMCLSIPPAAVRPGAPQGLAATIQGGRVVVSWDAPSASPIYRLKRVLGPGGGFEDIASALLNSRHAIPLTECSETFDCVVTAMNAGGESEPSAPLRVTVPGASVVRGAAPGHREGAKDENSHQWTRHGRKHARPASTPFARAV